MKVIAAGALVLLTAGAGAGEGGDGVAVVEEAADDGGAEVAGCLRG